ncbi:MAG: DNA primase [Caldilineaceae bacterium]|nr:DNA primase [Caldilineaceae bacterium]
MSVIDDIKARIDIVDLVSRYVPLKRAGRSYKACCPFHEERTPSFVVTPDRGTWYCFGACGEGGDIFSFLMKKENVDFRDALQILAKEAGVELVQPDENDENREREKLYDVNAQAAHFFRNQLHRGGTAQAARSYLGKRGINAAVAESFQLGFAPESWDSLRDTLAGMGYDFALQHRAGLLKYNEERDSYYDAFRNRLMIPICDRQGRIIGFGGRVLDDSVPKYLNTADTPLFHKSSVIYGFDKAYRAIRDADSVVIVEGYMDVIAAQQFGFANVVACMGTAITEEQLRQLQRYTNNFVLALDADNAGQQATIRGLNQARQALQRVSKPVIAPNGRVRLEDRLVADLRIVALPQGRDPDDIVREDADLWRDLVKNAQPLVDYYISVITAQTDLESVQGKGQAVAELAPLIAELGDEIERQHYTQLLSRLVQIDEQTIAHRVQSAGRSSSHRRPQPRVQAQPERGAPPPEKAGSVGGAGAERSAEDRAANGETSRLASQTPSARPQTRNLSGDPETNVERYLLAMLLIEPNLLIWLAEVLERLEIPGLDVDDLEDIKHREIFSALKRFLAGDELWDLENFQESLNSDLHEALAELMLHGMALPDMDTESIREAVVKGIVRMRRERLSDVFRTLNFLLLDAQESGDRQALMGFSAAINSNRRERHHLDRVSASINRTPYGVTRTEQGVRIA